jgi:hypothetical protein
VENRQTGTLGPQYRILAPKYDFFSAYKAGKIDADGYTEQFIEKVLMPLNPHEIYATICGRFGDDATLLCYEKPGDFCHRHIVAAWFKSNLGISVPELTFNQPSKSEVLIDFS